MCNESRRLGRGGRTLFAVLLTIAIFQPLASAQPPAQPAEGVPVRLDGEVLFYVRTPNGTLSAAERARGGEQRLLRIAGDPFYSEDLFALRQNGDAVTALYRDEIIGVITPEDASGVPGGPPALASQILQNVKAAIARHRARLLPAAWIRAGIIVGFSTLLLVAAIYVLRQLYRARAERMAHQRHEAIAAVHRQLLRLAFVALVGTLLFIYLEIAFSAIPLTRAYSLTVIDYVVRPLDVLWSGFRLHITDFFFILVVIALTYFLLKVLHWALSASATGAISLPFVSSDWALPLFKIVRIFVFILAMVTIYPYIPGSSTEAFKGIGLVGGALLTLGASSTAGNFIGGLVLIFTDTFRIGDIVRIGDIRGAVIETNLLITRIRTPKNDIVTMPNSAIMTGHLVNYSTKAREEGVILHTSVTIGYDAPWRTVHQLLVDAALKTPSIVPDPAPFVLQTSLNDFFVTYEINAYTQRPDRMAKIYAELHENIQDSFNAAGVEIMSPHYTSLRDGNADTMPNPQAPTESRRFGVRLEQPRSPV